MESNRPFLRLRGCGRLTNTALSSSTTERRRDAVSRYKAGPQAGAPQRGGQTRSSDLGWRLSIFIFNTQPIHCGGHRVTGRVGLCRDQRGSPQMALCHGNRHFQASACSDGNLLSGGDISGSVPLIVGEKATHRMHGGRRGEPRAPRFPFLVGARGNIHTFTSSLGGKHTTRSPGRRHPRVGWDFFITVFFPLCGAGSALTSPDSHLASSTCSSGHTGLRPGAAQEGTGLFVNCTMLETIRGRSSQP